MSAINLEKIDQLTSEGYITKRPHSSGDLFIQSNLDVDLSRSNSITGSIANLFI